MNIKVKKHATKKASKQPAVSSIAGNSIAVNSDYSDVFDSMASHLAALRPKWRNHFNVRPFKGSVNKQPSMTQPNQSMSIPELLQRFASGRDVAGFEPIYYGDFIIPSNRKLHKMDLADLEEIQKDLASQEDDINEKLKAAQTELQRREHEMLIESEVQKRLAAAQSPLPKDEAS